MKFLSLHNKYIYIIALVFIVILLAIKLFRDPVSMHISQTDHASYIDHNSHTHPDYETFREHMITIVKEENPTIAFEQIKELIKTDDVALLNCHSLVHEIGHVSYEKYGDFNKAMEYYDNMCNAGYIHGIMERHFSNIKDVYIEMNTVCSDQEQTVYSTFECYHGVGHGVMYYSRNDLPKALSICRTFDEEFKYDSCINGVMMENFNIHHKTQVSKFLDENNPLSPCSELDKEYKSVCYYYVPTYYLSLHPRDYKGMFALCQEAEGFVDWCANGIGAQAVKDNLRYPKKVEEICMMTPNESQKNKCLAGMIQLYMNHFREKGQEKVDCNLLEPSNREICETIKEDKYNEILRAK